MLRHQTEDGSFYETTWISDRKYNRSLNFDRDDPSIQRNITLTAHVLITLESVKDLASTYNKAIIHVDRECVKLVGDYSRWFEFQSGHCSQKGRIVAGKKHGLD